MSEYRGTKIEFAFSEAELKAMWNEAQGKKLYDDCPMIWDFIAKIGEYVDVSKN
jgi:hypothetical protein